MVSAIRSFSIVILFGLSTVTSAQLPPEIMADKHLILAEQLHAAKDYAGAFEVMQKIIALQKEHNLTLPDAFHFKYARVALSADSMQIALDSVNRYLSATGKEGEFYKEALTLLLKAEGQEVMTEEDFYNDVIKTQGTCDGLPVRSKCWMALTSHPECYVWNSYLNEGETAIWTGNCSGYVPDGKGTLTWHRETGNETWVRHLKQTGRFEKGKKEGKWVEQKQFYDTNWNVSKSRFLEYSYVNGKFHGFRIAHEKTDGTAYSGLGISLYLDGEYQDGIGFPHLKKREFSVETEGPDENGNGRVIIRETEGSVWGGPFVNGKKHGQWVIFRQKPYGKSEGPYVDGRLHGHWVSRDASGALISEGAYVEGKHDGKWVYRDRNGIEYGGVYVGGSGMANGLSANTSRI